MIVPVILSGGSGTRLWPLSTNERPKQFLPLVGPESLFRQTLRRVEDRSVYAAPIVVANAAHEQLCSAELEGIGDAVLLLEPVARNTAAAIAMAAEVGQAIHGPDAALLVMPSDHVIAETQIFHEAVAVGLAAARRGLLVTFGICPSGPETGYGYVKAGAAIDGAPGVHAVERFIEKPRREAAEAMIAAGNHFWNGGIFLFAAGDFLQELARVAPAIANSAKAAIAGAEQDATRVRPDREALEGCESISVDYAVMERSSRVATVPLDAGWSDVGSWDALSEIDFEALQDERITVVNSGNCYVRSDGLKVGLLGVEDLLVVAVGDRVLIMRRGQSQDVRQLAPAAQTQPS